MVGSKVFARLMCAGVSTISLMIFGVQPSTPTSTLFPSLGEFSSNRTADEFLFKSLTSTVAVLRVVRRGREGVSRACIAVAHHALTAALSAAAHTALPAHRAAWLLGHQNNSPHSAAEHDL